MKHAYLVFALFLLACTSPSQNEVPAEYVPQVLEQEEPPSEEPVAQNEEPLVFTFQKVPYSGDALYLSELSSEEIVQTLRQEYPNWDPVVQYEAGNSQEQEVFLENFGGYLTHEHMNELLRLIYAQNDILEGPQVLPKNMVEVFAPVRSCEDFLSLYLSSWPQDFYASHDPLYKYEDLETGDRLLISGLVVGSNKNLSTECTEHWNDVGGTYHSETHMSLFYDENDRLIYILTEDMDVDFMHGPIFQLTNLKTKEQWGARILANQMAVPHIEYFYYKN